MTAGVPLTDLAARIAEAQSKAMEALGADVHPYSGAAIREWEEIHADSLAVLLRRAQDAERELETLGANLATIIESSRETHARAVRLEQALREMEKARNRAEAVLRGVAVNISHQAGCSCDICRPIREALVSVSASPTDGEETT